MNQPIRTEDLDREYHPSAVAYRPLDEYLAGYAEQSRAARERILGKSDLHYGTGPDETLDLFAAPGKNAPLHVFIHGGYWRLLGKDDFSYLAPAFVKAGISVAVLNYSLLPRVQLGEIVDQCRHAIAWLHQNAGRLGFDPDAIHISGHSAGAHLCAMCLATAWEAEFNIPAGVIKSATLISGIYDLGPLRHVSDSEQFGFTKAVVEDCSPMWHPPRDPHTAVVMTYGEGDTTEFKRQTARYFKVCLDAGLAPTFVPMPDFDHFGVVSELGNSESSLFRSVLGVMQPGD